MHVHSTFALNLLWTGILLTETVKHERTSHISLHHYVAWSLIIVFGIVITYSGILYLGLDPLWSLGLARKWCASPDWEHPDTTPFFAFVRDISFLLGGQILLFYAHYSIVFFRHFFTYL